eukprot:TRINITY_DN10707_c0_g1_i3.p1 TRINITY_DN10707_c0_g1~~TRINITY_DN10707_c0_g1_i3.p1  ORF type:complete len:452 (+),score=96.27 TRINITY_DN10707_c0_g1_i3:97-1452(+)
MNARMREESPRYISPGTDELEESPYEKKFTTEEIKRRINKSLHSQSDEQIQDKPSYVENPSAYQGSQPAEPHSQISTRRVLPQAIHDEFEMNNTYSQKILQEAHDTGTKNLFTTSIRSESPFKYERVTPKGEQASTFYRKSPSRPANVERQYNVPAGPPNESHEILSRVFDGDLSVHSPSRKKQEAAERKSQSPAGDEKLRTTNTILEQFVDLSTSKDPRTTDRPRGLLEEAFEAAVEALGRPEKKSAEDYAVAFAGCVNNVRREVRLGGVVGVYAVWKAFPNEIGPEVFDHILQNLFTQLIHCENQEEIFLVTALELVGFLGPNEISCNSVSIIRVILFNSEPNSNLQTTSINTLVLLGYPGLLTLVDIASKDYQQLQQAILSRLCEMPFIQKCVLVPELLNELGGASGYKKMTTMVALNHCHTLLQLSLIHICRCRRLLTCRSRWSPYH